MGLLVTGVGFFFYQSAKTIPPSQIKNITVAKVSPTPSSSVFLTIETPKDEEVFDKKVIAVNGKTEPGAIIIVSTHVSDEVIEPASNGSFSTTITIEDGQNQLEITAIAPNGQETKITRTVTYSIESF